MSVTIKNRKLYESFLERVPILETLTKWERMTVADAIEPVTFKDGEMIIKEGDMGDKFYVVVEVMN
jgi:cAMP-dependent protein kinase regulator